FNPIGMTRTTFVPRENFAFPHSKTIDNQVYLLTMQDDESTEFFKPAGDIWSSAHDMGLYLITELKRGLNATGERIVDEHHLNYRKIPQVKTGHENHYGLGLNVGRHKGLTKIGHKGGTNGFGSLLGFYPEKQCGFVILTNGYGGHLLTDVIRRKLLELWFDTDEKSSETLIYNLRETKKYLTEFKEKLAEPPSDWIKSFLGKHRNDELGIFEIRQDGGDYILDIGIYKTKLMIHEEKNGKKTLAWITPPYIGFSLIPSEGESFKMVEEQHTYVFKKIG
ncbi:MAG: serine hydrolase domain-containing protein, partial [Ignavibacteria bacterium]|nr:serine hydrolase domain-containing protein [Ignavibacteria bacterium]